MINDRALLKLCLSELYQKMQYDDGYKPSQSDLEHICFLVEEKSKISLSLSTIKRVFQGKFERLPQASTLDALTLFLGYSGWQDFKAKKSLIGHIPQSVIPPAKGLGSRFHLNRLQTVLLFLVVSLVFIVLFTTLRSASIGNESVVNFSIRKIVSDEVPKNVIFDYNIDNIQGDSFFIQPSWSNRVRIKIHKHNYTQTETYYEPGFHTAKLICDGKVIKEVTVHIPTNDWIGYSKVKFTDQYPEYFKKESVIRDSILGISASGLRASNIAISDKRIYYFAHFPDSLNLSSNNFILKARIRMKPLGNTLCPWIISEVYSEHSFYFFTGTTPGCTSEAKAVFSDTYLDGKTNDLSSFGFDVMNWNEIMIKSSESRIAIYINEAKVFETQFHRAGGLVQGMGFGSNGLCEIDYVILSDSIGRVAYSNDFNKNSM